MKDKIITAILVMIVGIFLLPLAKFNDQQEIHQLQGFSARDIQYIESIGFVDNLNGSWTINITSLVSGPTLYYFDYQPVSTRGKIIAMRVRTATQLGVLLDGQEDILNGMFTIWGGDVS